MSILVKQPVSVLNRNIQVNFHKLFKSVFNATGNIASGNWLGAASNTTDLAKLLELEKLEPQQLAWLLIYRSLGQAIKQLIEERRELQEKPQDLDNIINQLHFSALEEQKLEINSDFFQQPKKLWQSLASIKDPLMEVLTGAGLEEAEAREISNRLPSYFVFALHEEWRTKSHEYAPLKEALNTPFSEAAEREESWWHYSAWLQQQVEKPVFWEAFSLKRIYIPLRAYYEQEKPKKDYVEEGFRENTREEHQRVVLDLEKELMNWVKQSHPENAIRVISGGPGSGKSSFCKMFAAELAETAEIRVLFIPLHLFDPTKDLVNAVQEFIDCNEILNHNPLDQDKREEKLLIIFDGLDELSVKGKLAEEVTKQFVEEVQRKVNQFNQQTTWLLVLLSGREVVVQALESKLRKPKQVLYLLPYLPYFVPEDEREKKQYIDEQGLLQQDQRHDWWQKYGEATGKNYGGLPKELSRKDLEEITAQPLLNYLVALSYTRGEIDLSTESNLNAIYDDLLKDIYERDYRDWSDEKGHPATGGLSLEQFTRILEEIAIATWHGNGRATTVQAIEERCNSSGIGKYLKTFKEGAEGGVTRLLTAFYFRQSGFNQGEETFEFTHKSFGEYLTVRRITRELKKRAKKLKEREDDPDEGGDEREALQNWAILCGPSAMDEYLHRFLKDELRLQNKETVRKLQQRLCELIGFMLKHGMPMEKLDHRLKFQEECRQSRNAEEALLVTLSSCASVTEEISNIAWPTENAFGNWLHKLRGQRIDFGEHSLALSCLNFLQLKKTSIAFQDLIRANFSGADLSHAHLSRAYLIRAHLSHAHLSRAHLRDADLSGASLRDADLSGAYLSGASLRDADLSGAYLSGASLRDADLSRAHLSRAHLSGAYLRDADLSGASLSRAHLSHAHLSRAHLSRTDLSCADLSRAYLRDADLSCADLSRAHLSGVTKLKQAQIESAHGDSSTQLPEGIKQPQHWQDK